MQHYAHGERRELPQINVYLILRNQQAREELLEWMFKTSTQKEVSYNFKCTMTDTALS